MRLSEHGFPEPVQKDAPYGVRPSLKYARPEEKRSQKQYQCNICKTHLYVLPFFKDYHTIPNYIMNTKNHPHIHQ